ADLGHDPLRFPRGRPAPPPMNETSRRSARDHSKNDLHLPSVLEHEAPDASPSDLIRIFGRAAAQAIAPTWSPHFAARAFIVWLTTNRSPVDIFAGAISASSCADRR